MNPRLTAISAALASYAAASPAYDGRLLVIGRPEGMAAVNIFGADQAILL